MLVIAPVCMAFQMSGLLRVGLGRRGDGVEVLYADRNGGQRDIGVTASAQS